MGSEVASRPLTVRSTLITDIDRLGAETKIYGTTAALKEDDKLAVRRKRKGLQLALEPLDGSGIAGYVPKP
jgi:hypothetical protein